MSKPIIGLNADFVNASGDKPAFTYVASGYYDAVSKVGGIPLIIPPLENDEDLEQVLQRVDGVVLVGGRRPRSTPRRLDAPSHRSPARRAPRNVRSPADAGYRRSAPARVRHRRRHAAPERGDGRQLLLHIPEDRPDALPHHDPIDPAHRHTLEITPGSLMERVYGDGELRVNSMHHMAVDEVAPGFEVTARCPDGIVEAIESRMLDWFAIGTQFHPEADTASALDLRIFEEFVDAVKESAAAVRLVA